MSAPTSSSSIKDNHTEGSASLKSSAKDSRQDAQPKTNTDLSKLDISTLSSEEVESLQDITDKRGRSKTPHMDPHQCIRKPSKRNRPSSDLPLSSSGLFTPPSSSNQTQTQTQPTSKTQETCSPEEGEIIIPGLIPSSKSKITRTLRPEDKEYLKKYGCVRGPSSQK